MALMSSSLLFVWEFIKRHPGIALVLVGVVGEVVFDWKEMKGRLAWAKRLSALLLISGLLLEFFEAAKSDRDITALNVEAGQARKEAGEATKQAAQSNERAKKLEVDAKQLEKQVSETKIELAKANERTALTESNNIVLKKELDQLGILFQQQADKIIQTESNVSKIDPLNLPIVSATAAVIFLLREQIHYAAGAVLQNTRMNRTGIASW